MFGKNKFEGVGSFLCREEVFGLEGFGFRRFSIDVGGVFYGFGFLTKWVFY